MAEPDPAHAEFVNALSSLDPEKDVPDEMNPNADGTFYQSQIGERPSKGHFFSPLDAQLAEAVHNDADSVVYTEEEERAVRKKIDMRVLTYLFNQFDRTNIGNVHVIDAFNENYGVTDNNKWTLALSVFYVGYCLLEMPANVLQRRIGANRFFFMSLTFWGVSSLSYVYGKGYAGLLVLRRVHVHHFNSPSLIGKPFGVEFFWELVRQGTTQAWCTTCHFGIRDTSLPCASGTYPGAVSGLIAFGLVRAHTSLLQGWQFLFLIEAIPTIVIASLILFFLPSFPFSATFLTPREKAIAQARMNRDQKPTSHGGMNGWQGFKAIVNDVNAWLLVVIYAGFNIGTATITYFLPTLIDELGYSDINAQGMTVAPYAVGWFLVIFQAWHSDRTRDRGWHVVGSMLTSFTGYVILATSVQKSVGAGYFALFLVVGGNFSLFPLVMSWAANVFSPTSKRGVGTAFIVSIANCISIASPQIYFDSYDDYRKGHAIAAGCMFLSTLATIVLRIRLSWMNTRNKEKLATLTEDEKNQLSDDPEIWDNDPRYVFMV
ncbi:uncharacterized protein FIBRA_07841 [Fibroporia radiculosa]|uniref:Major facilitator superfamily (MFS) profile domain-containing protein n=1 Tax=Fibroporia radiculosa TaxID=599839 RepID=J4I1H2_9APHY|nr:uncharacterized protein FIBRA_07841 [Fibroporia radiculosa]CCM05612.1 predicted protein [Fibroporia radiculosa]